MKNILSWQTRMLMGMLIATLTMMLIPFLLCLVPLNPLTIDRIEITNPGKIVVAGEQVFYKVVGVKNADKPARCIRQLVNERIIHYSPIESNLLRGTRQVRSYLNTSIGDMPGIYHMRYTVIYTYFYFRDVVVTTDSEKFTMVAPPEISGAKGDRGLRGPRGFSGE